MSVRPAKTQISLGIRPVWSESSLSAGRKFGSFATHWAHSEDSDQTGRTPRLILVFAGRTLIWLVLQLVLSCRGSFLNRLYANMTKLLISCVDLNWKQCTSVLNNGTGISGHMTKLWYENVSRTILLPPVCIWARSCENMSYAICEQQRCRSACTSTQSDQHLCCSLLR